MPLLLVAIARDEVPADTHRLRRLRAQLRRECDLLELPLRPFDREDTARLAATVAGEELDDERRRRAARTHARHPVLRRGAGGDASRCDGRRDAGGLPLPETVLDAVLLRTEALSLPARNALEKAAVVGQRCEIAACRRRSAPTR